MTTDRVVGLPATMFAAVYRPECSLVIEELPVPRPGAGEVLVEVSHCGICGSDLHLAVEGWGQPWLVPGHEWSGTVVAVGDDVATWRPGDMVVGGPTPGCGHCEPCGSGWPHLCLDRPRIGILPYQGAFAQYHLAPAPSLHRVPEDLGLRTAVLTEPLAVAVHSLECGRERPGDRVLITGAGPIGLLTVLALQAEGATDVTVSEPVSRRRELAQSLGAAVVAPDDLACPELPIDVIDKPFDVVFECSGRRPAIEAGLAALGRRGVLVLCGTGPGQPALDPHRIILNELRIVGAVGYVAADFRRALDLLASGRMPVDELIQADDVPLDETQRAMERLAAGELSGKVLVNPHRLARNASAMAATP